MSTSYDLSSAYEGIFTNISWYNNHSQTEMRYLKALHFLKKYNVSSVLDIGSGRGNFLRLIKNNYDTIFINSCDFKNFHNLDFVEHYDADIRIDVPAIKTDIVTCLDVLEHLPKDDIDAAIANMKKIAKFFVFSVSNHSDVIDGKELHLTQINFENWKNLINPHCNIDDSLEVGVTYFFCGEFKLP